MIESKRDLELIKEKLETVKKAGHGEVIIKVADGKVVYISHSIGERITKADDGG